MNANAIETQGLTRTFGQVRAVDDLTLAVPSGTVFGFLGPNGAGKTTTLRLLLGLLEPTSGSATVLGYDILRQADEIRARCGALLEFNGIYERLSAEDNLEFYGRVYHLPAGERQARIKDLLTHLDLWDRRGELAGTWSRGMKQKLAVARALLHHPALIFLDEPTAGLDPIAAAALRDDLASLASREGVTIFLTTHNLVEAEKLCQQVAVIRTGQLVTVGAIDQLRKGSERPVVEVAGKGFSETVLSALRSRPEVETVTLRDGRLVLELRQEVEAAPLVSAIVMAGGQVEEVHKARLSLEDVFLTLMKEEAEND